MDVCEKDLKEIISKAMKMREYSYSPYSRFSVGAALLCRDGSIFGGCNIENAAFGPGVCAERCAIQTAISEGYRDFKAIAVCGGIQGTRSSVYAAPCGVCRQVLREFCSPDFEIILVNNEEDYRICTLEELLPISFGPDNLE